MDGGEDLGDKETKEVVEGDGEDVDEDEGEEDPVLAHHVKGVGSVFVTANVASWDEETDREHVEDHHQTTPQSFCSHDLHGLELVFLQEGLLHHKLHRTRKLGCVPVPL